MRILEKFIVDKLLADPTLQGFIGNRVFPQGVDITPEVQFPLITFFMVGETTATNPKGVKENHFTIDIWSNSSHLETVKISDRVVEVLNFKQFNSGYEGKILRWSREDSGSDLFESDRRIWHRSLRFIFWAYY